MRRTFLRLAPMLLALAASPAFGDEAAKRQDPRAAFAETDENKDGRIDREEFQHRVVEIFYFADRDKDGYLSHEEVIAGLVFPEDFAHADRDGDGRISLYEFVQVRFATFDEVDADHDGVLSVEEVVTATRARSDPPGLRARRRDRGRHRRIGRRSPCSGRSASGAAGRGRDSVVSAEGIEPST